MTDRAVSVTLNYIIMLGIATVLLISLLTVAGGLIDSQTNHAIHDELDVTGQTLAADIQNADRLLAAGEDGDTNVSVKSTLPNTVAGNSYEIVVNGTDDELRLRTHRPEVEVVVSYAAENVSKEEEMVVSGGPVEIYTNDEDKLEVREA